MKKSGGTKNENSLIGWINADEFVDRPQGRGPELHPAEGRRRDQHRSTELHRRRARRRRRLDDRAPGRRRAATRSLKIVDGKFKPVFGKPGKPFLCFPDDLKKMPEEPRGQRLAGRWSPRRTSFERDPGDVTDLDRLRHPGHPVRLRVRAGRGRPRPHLQDVGGLQPRVRGAGVRVGGGLLRAPGRRRVADHPGVRRRGGRRRAAARLRPRPVHLPVPAHRPDGREARRRRSACSSRSPRS